MPLPPHVVFAALIPCDTVLLEQDGTASAIRIFDAVYLPRSESASGQMNLLFATKFEIGYDPSERQFSVDITNPAGITSLLMNPQQVSLKPPQRIDPTTPVAANIALQIMLQGKGTGIHKLRAYIDDQEVATTTVTFLLEREQPTR